MREKSVLCFVLIMMLLVPSVALSEDPQRDDAGPRGVLAYPVFDSDATRMRYDIWVLDLETGDKEVLLENASQPAFSYDSEALAYKSWIEDQDVYGLHAASLNDIEGTDWRFGDSLADQRPKWSPDDAFFYYFSRDESDRENRVMATESLWTRGHRILRPDADMKEVLGKSPGLIVVKKDTYDILYQGCEFGDCGILKRNVDGTSPKQITEGRSDLALSVSPDSKSIAFMAYDRDDDWEIYVMDANGSKVTRLTHNPGADGLPTWSPDGDWIAFVRESSPGSWDIMAIKPDGTGEQKLTELGELDGMVKGATPDQCGGWMEEQITWGTRKP